MPVILYRDANFAGPIVRLQPGFYSGRRDLEGAVRGSSTGEDLDNQISSIRVDNGYIAVLFGGYSASASGGARTLIGPTDVPDLAAVGMDDKTSAVQVLMFEPFSSAVPRDFGVTLYSDTYKSGTQVHIGQGSFDRARLDSDEIKLGPRGVQSLCVGPNTIAVLYEGNTFESTLDSVVVGPGTCVPDVEQLGMIGSSGVPRISSIRVLYAAATPSGGHASVSTGLSPWERAMATLGTPAYSQRAPGAQYAQHAGLAIPSIGPAGILDGIPTRSSLVQDNLSPPAAPASGQALVTDATPPWEVPVVSATPGVKTSYRNMLLVLVVVLLVIVGVLWGVVISQRAKPAARAKASTPLSA